ncbi:hypothetical protein MIR68_011996 [Amoeboaphelidium protococcarum]|nr:hypothetical protein MIR68_011996 [Amoeboaphelidium protococcarum]
MTTNKDQTVYIAAAVRTPIGGFNGSLASFSATELGSLAIDAALKRGGIQADLVDEVFMGNVLSANVGQNPARQAALFAKLPNKVPCTTVNKVCASGMKAVMLGAQSIMLGQNDIVVAGGMESMSNCPYYVPKARFGAKYGHQEMVDGIVKDGLFDVYNKYLMGEAAELCAKEHQFTREQQDDFAVQSYKRAQDAFANKSFDHEIVPVSVNNRGKVTVVSLDDEVANLNEDKLRSVKPAFKSDGSVTAPNSSTLSDGAAAIVLISGEKARQLGVKVLAKICSFADAAQEPERFTTAPALAIPSALARAGLSKDQVDFFEVNEAFAVVALANIKLLNLDPAKVNVYGGSVSMGHPLGCSGARIIATLLSALQNNQKKIGCAGVCNGGGGASAIVIERV